MEPTLKSGSFVLVSSIPYLLVNPKVGDIIAFKKENKIFIKRIAKINPSRHSAELSRSPSSGKKYFVKGDNEKDSLDSRKLGWIEMKNIVGKVIIRFQ